MSRGLIEARGTKLDRQAAVEFSAVMSRGLIEASAGCRCSGTTDAFSAVMSRGLIEARTEPSERVAV